ncbi:pyruvate dehydrogenase E2 component (dihydrolipoamideacetyltransferase) [Galdieria sulphuraria]|uniref:Acetyltransferase component of pyruvate dehydrogenase complex n=1 Tax=Galdieria sulphuraria TaxID=130081 RepID=M2Y567_GALSU|nr:pyruvate dehydrogenase E2 component (dihydrolipoamideacetyltransferase) [Galdieria sulphuraria]EME30999.1 pyruvate dehydrogenase E2 component (dihydrolipoamideacetyltransferase) [Galdieria sulphuraria]|eukprot:XP_005707519.1 pyruvate dehydrogenase E2 component (dihydrolipoamideacetyltransferase) [Galdieria sulphuraria]
MMYISRQFGSDLVWSMWSLWSVLRRYDRQGVKTVQIVLSLCQKSFKVPANRSICVVSCQPLFGSSFTIRGSSRRVVFGGSNTVSVRWFADLPPYSLLRMPSLSPTMKQGNIIDWKKKEGDKLSPGDVIADIETDKATMEFECQDEGYLAKILLKDGTQDVSIGKPVAVIVEDEEELAAFKDVDPSQFLSADTSSSSGQLTEQQQQKVSQQDKEKKKPTEQVSPKPSREAAVAQPIVQKEGKDRTFASPYAQKLAYEKGVDINRVSSSGPSGRVLANDILAASEAEVTTAAVSGSAAYTDIKLSNMRKTIAERLLESKQTIPHYYLTATCRIDKLLQVREQMNAKAKNGEYKISINDFIIKACAVALQKVPEVNSQWLGSAIRRFYTVDVSVAVQTDTGLITPIVKDADRKGLRDISEEMKQLANKARENRLQPSEYVGGTFTVSNLGMFGVDQFSAIINPPQAAILAVGSSTKTVLPGHNGEVVVGNTLKVTMSCDHRVVDGAVGARWLKTFKDIIEEPINMLL